MIVHIKKESILIEVGVGQSDIGNMLLRVPPASSIPGNLDHLLKQNGHEQLLSELTDDLHQFLVPLPLLPRT